MKKKNYPKISKEVYKKLMQEIKDSFESLGCSFKLYKRPIIWRRHGTERANFGEIRGSYITPKKRAIVVCYGNIGRGKILATALHELRHAMHHQQGLYKDYYDSKWDRVFSDKNYIPKERPNMKTALLAERDCNRFAYTWLKERGITIPKDFSYPYTGTMAYFVNQEIKKRLKS